MKQFKSVDEMIGYYRGKGDGFDSGLWIGILLGYLVWGIASIVFRVSS